MKKLLSVIALLMIVGCTNAQDTTNKQNKPIPHYRMLTTDSVFVTDANLKKNKPTMVIYFSPDCSHCQRMMFELKPKMKELAKMQVIMITFSRDYDIRGIREFKTNFDLAKYPNIVIGTEGYTGLVQRYYEIKTTPFIAVYDSKGHVKKVLDKTPKTEDILEAIKKASI